MTEECTIAKLGLEEMEVSVDILRNVFQGQNILSYFQRPELILNIPNHGSETVEEHKHLNPVWLMNALYAIMNEGRAYSSEGTIRISGIEQMLQGSVARNIGNGNYCRPKPDYLYDSDESAFIIGIAEFFKLCSRINSQKLFFPSYCEEDIPDNAEAMPDGYPLRFEYRFIYDEIPESILHQLMVDIHKSDFKIYATWKKGLTFGSNETHKAVITVSDTEKLLNVVIWTKNGYLASKLFPQLRKMITRINITHNFESREYIVDDDKAILIEDLVQYLRNEAETEEKRNARKLLSDFFEGEQIDCMYICESSGRMDVKPFEYHMCKKNDRYLREALYNTYKNCPYCGMRLVYADMQVDHILPTKREKDKDYKVREYLAWLSSKGFNLDKPDYIENYLPSRPSCNRKKTNKTMSLSCLLFFHEIARENASKVIELLEAYKAEDKASMPRKRKAVQKAHSQKNSDKK